MKYNMEYNMEEITVQGIGYPIPEEWTGAGSLRL
jgi:hypothetical protein